MMPTETERIPSHIVDAGGRIRVDVPCANCGYSARTLQASSRCPECGLQVSESIRSTRLCLAPYDQLRSITQGVTLTIAAMAIGGIVLVATPIISVLVLGATGTVNWPLLTTALIADGCVSLVAVCIMVIAVQRIAGWARGGNEPMTFPSKQVKLLWIMIRAVFLVQVLALLSVASLTITIDVWTVSLVYVSRTAAQIATYFVFPALLFHHLGALTGRIPAPRLARCLGLIELFFAVVTIAALFEAVGMFTFEIRENPTRPATELARDVLLYVHPLTNCLHIPLGIVAFVVLLVSRSAIRKATRLAGSFQQR